MVLETWHPCRVASSLGPWGGPTPCPAPGHGVPEGLPCSGRQDRWPAPVRGRGPGTQHQTSVHPLWLGALVWRTAWTTAGQPFWRVLPASLLITLSPLPSPHPVTRRWKGTGGVGPTSCSGSLRVCSVCFLGKSFSLFTSEGDVSSCGSGRTLLRVWPPWVSCAAWVGV